MSSHEGLGLNHSFHLVVSGYIELPRLLTRREKGIQSFISGELQTFG